MSTVQLDLPNDLLELPNQTTASQRLMSRWMLLTRRGMAAHPSTASTDSTDRLCYNE